MSDYAVSPYSNHLLYAYVHDAFASSYFFGDQAYGSGGTCTTGYEPHFMVCDNASSMALGAATAALIASQF